MSEKNLNSTPTRRQARELAFQFLFAHLPATHDEVQFEKRSFEDFSANFGIAPDPFAWEVVTTTGKNLPAIDQKISALSAHWRIERMPRVDLTILRMTSAELLFRSDIPKSVAINEAVELAKRFGAEESPSFVNGILDKIDVESDVKTEE